MTALVGSSVNFTWSFTGDVGYVHWGLKNPDLNDIKYKLVALDSSGLLPVPVPQAYAARVRGGVNFSSGPAIFILASVREGDETFYGCMIRMNSFPLGIYDFVQLVVLGEHIRYHYLPYNPK